MITVTATEARKQLYKLLDDVSDSHEPVQITGKRGNAVLVGEDDWRAVQETLYLVSIPGMRESIIEAWRRRRRNSTANSTGELELVYTRQAQKDAEKLTAAGLKPKAQASWHPRREPVSDASPFEKLVGDCPVRIPDASAFSIAWSTRSSTMPRP